EEEEALPRDEGGRGPLSTEIRDEDTARRERAQDTTDGVQSIEPANAAPQGAHSLYGELAGEGKADADQSGRQQYGHDAREEERDIVTQQHLRPDRNHRRDDRGKERVEGACLPERRQG